MRKTTSKTLPAVSSVAGISPSQPAAELRNLTRNETKKRLTSSAGLSQMTVVELRAELGEIVTITAKHLIRIAEIWNELKCRGEDLSTLRSGLWEYMPLVASGDLEPELVVRHAGNPRLLRRLAALPRFEQDIVLVNDSVGVVEIVNGEFVRRNVPVSHLSIKELDFVFRGRILSHEEQVRLITQKQQKPITLKRALIQENILDAARQKSLKSSRDKMKTISVSISQKEAEFLRERAGYLKLSVSAVVTSALRVVGLLDKP